MAVTEGSGHILCVVGARPNFMKIAPVMRAFSQPECDLSAQLLHTGQHYDAAMKHAFFEQLHIPEPDVDLGVGSGSHAQQTAEIMKCFEPVLDESPPVAVLVVGMSTPRSPAPWSQLKRAYRFFMWRRGFAVATRQCPRRLTVYLPISYPSNCL